MPLAVEDVRRFARQIALPDIGVAGQERLFAAEVTLAGEGPIVDTAEMYLRAAGVGRVRRAPAPREAAAITIRAAGRTIELTALRRGAAPLELNAEPGEGGAAAVLAGTLAA